MRCDCDNGKIKVTAMLYTDRGLVPQKPVIMDCIWCEGTGMLTEHQYQSRQNYTEAWCNCGNPSGETSFYRHGHSHGYNCADCGKILQTG
jgi:hypothetical protein